MGLGHHCCLPGLHHDFVEGCQPSPLNGAVFHDTCPTNPQLVMELFLLFGSFSLCPHSGRLAGSCDRLYVTQISTFQNFPLWLIWTSSLPSLFTHLTWDLILLENTMETFCSHSWPQTGPSCYTTSASKICSLSSICPFYVQLLPFCFYGIKLIYCHLSSF